MPLDVAALEREIAHADEAEIGALYVTLSALLARAEVRLQLLRTDLKRLESDRFLSPLAAAEFLDLRDRQGRISARWLYDHWQEIEGAQKLVGKLRFSMRGLRRHKGR